MTAIAAPAGFSMGQVINRLFSVLGHNIVQFLLLSALLVGLPTALVNVVEIGLVPTNPTSPFTSERFELGFGIGLAAALFSLACNAVLQAAVIHATVNDLTGRRANLGESLAVGLRYFLPLVGITLIAGIGCFVGAVFFIVPGVLLALALSVAAPAAVMERTGVFGALSRSIELTRNHRGAIFALSLGYFVVVWLIEMVVGALIAAFSFASLAGGGRAVVAGGQGLQTLQWVSVGLGLVMSTLLASVSSVGIASIYFELRQAKEGVGVEQLAAVFD